MPERYGVWDKPRFHRLDLSSEVCVGSGGRPFQGKPYETPPRRAPCKPYGGDCLGDGCAYWFPLPSPQGCQEATCGLSRAEQPIALPEAKRRVRQNIHVGNEATRLGWLRSAQIAYQRAWSYAFLVEEIIEAGEQRPSEKET